MQKKHKRKSNVTIQYRHPDLHKGKWWNVGGSHKSRKAALMAINYKASMFTSDWEFRLSSEPTTIYKGFK